MATAIYLQGSYGRSGQFLVVPLPTTTNTEARGSTGSFPFSSITSESKKTYLAGFLLASSLTGSSKPHQM